MASCANMTSTTPICAKSHWSRLVANPDAKLMDTRSWDDNLRKVKEDGLASVGNDSDPKSLLERDGLKVA